MSNIQVLGLPQSNFVWAVRIALAEKGVAYELVPAPPHSPQVTALHPLGKIPVLRHGETTVCESRAIIDYIDEAFDGPPLVPSARADRIRSDIWTSIIATSVEPLIIRQFVFAYLFPATPDRQPDEALIAELAPKVETVLAVLEDATIADELGGPTFGRTDIYLVPVLYYLRGTPRGQTLIAAHPQLNAYLDRHLARPSVQSTLPSWG